MAETSVADRSRRLLREARFLTLATVSVDGLPWAAVLQYAWLTDPLRFLFGSATGARHSRDIAARPRVSGSLFVAGDDLMAVDGAQFTGTCAEVSDVDSYYEAFYTGVLPDPRQRAEWMLPSSALRPPAEHRIYLIEVERWWLVDTRTWAADRIDRRIEMSLAELGST